jgi:hypothetical protein
MKLYYTGSKTYLGTQQKKEFSLGGFVSASIVPNNQLGNLFSDITKYTKGNEITEVIGIVLKNELDGTASDIVFNFDIPEDAVASYEIAAVQLSQDGNGNYYMEEISNQYALPYYATFYSADDGDNKVNLGSLISGGMLGLWIKRKVSFTASDCDQLFIDFKAGTEVGTKEQIGLIFDWTLIGEESSSSSGSSSSGSSSSGVSISDSLFNPNGYDVSLKLLEYTSQTGNLQVAIPANSRLLAIDLVRNVDPTNMKVGTTLDGEDWLPEIDIEPQSSITIGQTYTEETIVYFGINSGNVSIFVYYYEL